ncbi:hypothetical protein L1787_20815 [Acuticoccus sp. M5D2P5]|uniref:DUF7220 family protein n=1 Tax=Acuticoccus kalidii TaxID=2910977 RepID=UPI001F1DD840|nr:hypothetical protein [Acuticoccus kalidii]MCF3934147.1 hypothetical protein [Acuticoccus kalidii]MCF3935316.1 hypothetical protein [Acuticoccus kalidii]MCF3935324.1 hypothetical protein [Acuticoccus kalidii]MCF3935837.1 hypothetical protein [Acuticoccus kalidii]
MSQSRAMSLLEAVVNVLAGYGLAVITQLLLFPLFGLPAHLGTAAALSIAFSVISIVRSFIIRRFFERLRIYRG